MSARILECQHCCISPQNLPSFEENCFTWYQQYGFNILLLIIVSANQYELLKPKVSSLFGYDTQFVEASRSGMISINQFQLNPCHDIWRGTLWRELLMLPPHIDLGAVVFAEKESHPGSELNAADFRKLS